MHDKFIRMLPIELKNTIFFTVCRNMRENVFRNEFPCDEIKKELLSGQFHSRKKIYADNTHMIGLEAMLEYELDRDVNMKLIDFMYYQSTSTRFYLQNSKEYVTVCGYSRQNDTKTMICTNCGENSILLSHKRKSYVCKYCKSKYVQ